MSGGAALHIAPAPAREAPTDHDLVAAVRRGHDDAFTELYARYQRRVHAYVLGMVKDHGRAEDVTQEIFIAAYRRMRETERPIAFKPWVYEIARNACIDAFRRGRRAEEVSFDAGADLPASDQARLQSDTPTPDAQVDAKQQLDHLCGAFGGLSEAHHKILVLRELEGLSYKEIGDQLGMSRPAVESTLFRARRRLTEEYDELASGERCLRVQGIVSATAEGMSLGARDQRRLALHVAHCQPCRRHAVAAGLDTAALTRRSRRDRVAEKIAGLLPFPLPSFLRLRSGAESAATVAGQNAEPIAGWGKAAAALATVVLAGVGAGVGTRAVRGDVDAARSEQVAPGRPASHSPATPDVTTVQPPAVPGAAGRQGSGQPVRSGERAARRDRSGGGAGSGGAPSGPGEGSRGAGGGGAPASAPNRSTDGAGGPSAPDAGGRTPGLPGQTLRDAGKGAGDTVSGVGGGLGDTVSNVGNGVGDTVSNVGSGVGDTVSGVGGGVGDAVRNVGNGAGDTVSGAGQGVSGAVQGAGEAAGDTVRGVGETVQRVGNAAPGVVGDAVGGAGQAVQGVGGAAGSATGQAGSAVGSAGGQAGSAVGSASGQAGSAVGSAGDRVGSTVGSATDAVGSAGEATGAVGGGLGG